MTDTDLTFITTVENVVEAAMRYGFPVLVADTGSGPTAQIDVGPRTISLGVGLYHYCSNRIVDVGWEQTDAEMAAWFNQDIANNKAGDWIRLSDGDDVRGWVSIEDIVYTIEYFAKLADLPALSEG